MLQRKAYNLCSEIAVVFWLIHNLCVYYLTVNCITTLESTLIMIWSWSWNLSRVKIQLWLQPKTLATLGRATLFLAATQI